MHGGLPRPQPQHAPATGQGLTACFPSQTRHRPSDAAVSVLGLELELAGRGQVFDLSATVKKMRKGGSAEFRKVLFYPSQKAVEYANSILKARGTSPDSPELFPSAAP